jgi:hypothetical protein
VPASRPPRPRASHLVQYVCTHASAKAPDRALDEQQPAHRLRPRHPPARSSRELAQTWSEHLFVSPDGEGVLARERRVRWWCWMSQPGRSTVDLVEGTVIDREDAGQGRNFWVSVIPAGTSTRSTLPPVRCARASEGRPCFDVSTDEQTMNTLESKRKEPECSAPRRRHWRGAGQTAVPPMVGFRSASEPGHQVYWSELSKAGAARGRRVRLARST